jgi:RES domain
MPGTRHSLVGNRLSLTGAGSRGAGGRWNPLGSFATVYASLDIYTAADEVLASHRYYHLPEPTAFPKIMASVSVQLQHVLNLTIGEVRRTLRVGDKRIREDDWRAQQDAGNESLTQAIGRAAKEGGLEWRDCWYRPPPGARASTWFSFRRTGTPIVGLIRSTRTSCHRRFQGVFRLQSRLLRNR